MKTRQKPSYANGLRGLILLVLLTANGATARNVFDPRTEYTYQYVGYVTAGIPSVSNEVNSVGIKCEVLVQGFNDEIVVKLQNVASHSGVITVRNNTPVEIPVYNSQASDHKVTLPFKLKYSKDELKSIEVSANDVPESVNIKKALAALLTVQLENPRSWDYGSPTQRDQKVFYIEEDGYDGRCQSRYTIEKLPWSGNPTAQVLNITKSRSSQQCREQPVYKISINEPKKCVSCESEALSFINYGVKTQYNIEQKAGRFLLETATTTGRGAFTAFSSKGDSVTFHQYQKLTLLKVGSFMSSNKFVGTGTSYMTFGITPPEIDMKARYKRNTKTTRFSTKTTDVYPLNKLVQKKTPSQNAQVILDNAVEECSDMNNCTMETGLIRIYFLVQQLRKMDYEEVRQFIRANDNNDKKRNVAIDAVAMSGTDAAITAIIELIQEGSLKGEAAVQAVSSLPAYVLEPQPDIVEKLWDLSKHRGVIEKRQLLVTTLLAFGEMVNQACVPKETRKTTKPYHIQSSECPHSRINKYLQELMNTYENNDKPWMRSAIMNTIAKMGLNQSLDYLAPYLQSKMFSLPVGQRIEIMMPLYELEPSAQQEIIKYILPIFYNKTLTSEERIQAFLVLQYITTSQDLVNEIALSSWEEPSQQVAAAVYNYYKNMAKVDTPCWKPMAVRSEKALPLVKPVTSGMLDSGLQVFLTKPEKWGLHSTFMHSITRSSKSLLPQMTYNSLTEEIGGYYYTVFDVYTLNDGLQQVVNNLIGPKVDFTNQQFFSDIFKSEEDSYDANYDRDSNDDVKVATRSDEPFYSRIALTYLQDRHRMFFLDQHFLDDIRDSGVLPPNKDLYSSLRDGIPINYRKHMLIVDSQLKFSSVIGTPMTISVKVPAIVDIHGVISAQAAKSGVANTISNFAIKPELTTTIGVNLVAGVQMEDIFNQISQRAGVVSRKMLHLPLNLHITADLNKKSFNLFQKVKETPGTEQQSLKEQKIFQQKSEPLLLSYDIKSDKFSWHRLTKNSEMYKNKKDTYFGTWTEIQDTKYRERLNRKQDSQSSYMDYFSFWWLPNYFNYDELGYETFPLQEQETAIYVNWEHTASPYESELWKGKSPLQQLRPWNFIPEWKDVDMVCHILDARARLENVTPTSKDSWFSRIKDRVRNPFGRSGGSDDDDETATPVTDDDDRGRGLHPHHKVTDTDSGSQFGGQGSTSLQGSYGFSGQVGGGSSFSQTHTGSGGFGSVSQSHTGMDYDGDVTKDFTQQSTKHTYPEQTHITQKGSGVGTAFSQFGSKGEPGKVVSPKGSVVYRLKHTNEVSQTMISIQMMTKRRGQQSKTNIGITIRDNKAQATKSISANADIKVTTNREQNLKICLTGYYFGGHKECPLSDSFMPNFETKISWGETRCEDRSRFIQLKGNYSIRDEDRKLFDKFQKLCETNTQQGYMSKECEAVQQLAATLTKANYELRYTEGYVNRFLDDVAIHLLRDHPEFLLSKEDAKTRTDDGLATLSVEYDINDKMLELDFHRPHGYVAFHGVPYDRYFGLAEPKSRGTSTIVHLSNKLKDGGINKKCIVGPDTVSTFNDVTYNFTLQTCPHVVAKDCSSSRLFTVTASSNKIVVNIDGHKIESSKDLGSSNTFRSEVIIDGKTEEIKDREFIVVRSQDNDDSFIAQISGNNPFITIKSPSLGLIVTYSRRSLSVVVSQFWHGKVCGLCGENTDDSQTTFLSPDQCLYADAKSFANSYLVPSSQCSTPYHGYQESAPCQPFNKIMRAARRTSHTDYGSGGSSDRWSGAGHSATFDTRGAPSNYGTSNLYAPDRYGTSSSGGFEQNGHGTGSFGKGSSSADFGVGSSSGSSYAPDSYGSGSSSSTSFGTRGGSSGTFEQGSHGTGSTSSFETRGFSSGFGIGGSSSGSYGQDSHGTGSSGSYGQDSYGTGSSATFGAGSSSGNIDQASHGTGSSFTGFSTGGSYAPDSYGAGSRFSGILGTGDSTSGIEQTNHGTRSFTSFGTGDSSCTSCSGQVGGYDTGSSFTSFSTGGSSGGFGAGSSSGGFGTGGSTSDFGTGGSTSDFGTGSSSGFGTGGSSSGFGTGSSSGSYSHSSYSSFSSYGGSSGNIDSSSSAHGTGSGSLGHNQFSSFGQGGSEHESGTGSGAEGKITTNFGIGRFSAGFGKDTSAPDTEKVSLFGAAGSARIGQGGFSFNLGIGQNQNDKRNDRQTFVDEAQTSHKLGMASDDGGCYIRRNQMKLSTRNTYKMCFSTEAIRQCRVSCIGHDFVPVNVKFQCYDESSQLAKQLRDAVEQRPLTELKETSFDFEEEIMIPQKCLNKN